MKVYLSLTGLIAFFEKLETSCAVSGETAFL